MKLSNHKIVIITALSLIGILFSCGQEGAKSKYPLDEPLPIIGPQKVVNGEVVPHQIPDFSFIDQDSNVVSQETVEGKVYVADFFFSTCPDICPKMSQQMIRLHDVFIDNDSVVLLSHSLDPDYDTPEVLKKYADGLQASSNKWHLMTGYSQSFIYNFGQTNYLVTAKSDESAGGGILHSGHFLLVDSDRHIRGVYDGTLAEEVDLLIFDIKRLLNEK